MSDALTLRLLGKPHVGLGGAVVTGFISAKAQALLFYLATTGRPHTREALAGLLWGDLPEAQAGKNLRNAISNLWTLVGPYLLITRDEAVFNRDSPYGLDVEVFLASMADPARKDLEALHKSRPQASPGPTA